MKKQTISFDLDDTLFDAIRLMVDYSNKHWGTRIKFSELDDSDRLFPSLSGDEENRLWLRFLNSPEAKDHAPSKDIKNAIDALSKNYRLIIVSARDMILQKSAVEWVNKFFPGKFDKVIFKKTRTGNVTKSSICLRERAILHIDDNQKHVKDCMDNGIPAVLVSRPWNRKAKLDVPIISEVSLSRIKKMISYLS